MTPRRARAHAFAAKHFGACEAHRGQAVAVYEALEALAERSLLELAPESTIGDIVGHDRGLQPEETDSLERVELEMALEEELGAPALVAAGRRLDHALAGRFVVHAFTVEGRDARPAPPRRRRRGFCF